VSHFVEMSYTDMVMKIFPSEMKSLCFSGMKAVDLMTKMVCHNWYP
jgi:hypothetical protein